MPVENEPGPPGIGQYLKFIAVILAFMGMVSLFYGPLVQGVVLLLVAAPLLWWMATVAELLGHIWAELVRMRQARAMGAPAATPATDAEPPATV